MQTQERPFSGPYSPVGALPLPIQPARYRKRLCAALERLADLQQELIAELDRMDGDPDFEPSLARPEGLQQGKGRAYGRRIGTVDDREEACEDEGAQCDDEGVSGLHDPDREPWLGALEKGPGGSAGWHSETCDREVNGDETDTGFSEDDGVGADSDPRSSGAAVGIYS